MQPKFPTPEERASCTIASGSIAMPDTAAATPKWPTGIRRPGMAKVIWDLHSEVFRFFVDLMEVVI